jgi:hypothetical protein
MRTFKRFLQNMRWVFVIAMGLVLGSAIQDCLDRVWPRPVQAVPAEAPPPIVKPPVVVWTRLADAP